MLRCFNKYNNATFEKKGVQSLYALCVECFVELLWFTVQGVF